MKIRKHLLKLFQIEILNTPKRKEKLITIHSEYQQYKSAGMTSFCFRKKIKSITLITKKKKVYKSKIEDKNYNFFSYKIPVNNFINNYTTVLKVIKKKSSAAIIHVIVNL